MVLLEQLHLSSSEEDIIVHVVTNQNQSWPEVHMLKDLENKLKVVYLDTTLHETLRTQMVGVCPWFEQEDMVLAGCTYRTTQIIYICTSRSTLSKMEISPSGLSKNILQQIKKSLQQIKKLL